MPLRSKLSILLFHHTSESNEEKNGKAGQFVLNFPKPIYYALIGIYLSFEIVASTSPFFGAINLPFSIVFYTVFLHYTTFKTTFIFMFFAEPAAFAFALFDPNFQTIIALVGSQSTFAMAAVIALLIVGDITFLLLSTFLLRSYLKKINFFGRIGVVRT